MQKQQLIGKEKRAPFGNIYKFYNPFDASDWIWSNFIIRAALVWWLREETQVLKVVGSNPSAVYWMDMTFFTLICCKNCIVCLKRPKINEKEAGDGPFLKFNLYCKHFKWAEAAKKFLKTLYKQNRKRMLKNEKIA